MDVSRRESLSRFVDWVKANPLILLGVLVITIPTMRFVAEEGWTTEQGGHAPLVLATGIWLLLRQWPKVGPLMAPPPTWRVMVLFAPLAIAYFVTRVSQIVELEGYVMYGVLLVVLYSYVGGRAMAAIWFPLLYLTFVFPPPQTIIDWVTNPMKMWISRAAVDLLYQLGYPIAGAGVTIQIGQYQLLVAAACSGLNSIISLTAISLLYVYIRHEANVRYSLLLFLLVLPVAIFANFVRVLILILLTYYAGEATAQGFLHQFAGLTMFVTALLTIFALDSVLIRIIQRRRHHKARMVSAHG